MSWKVVTILAAFVAMVVQAGPRIGYSLPIFGFGNGRIVGGNEAERGEFPHQVTLQWRASSSAGYQHFCGGTIIDDRWIMTAGHCVLAVPGYGSFVVKAGKHSIRVEETGEQLVEVSQTFVHEDYNGNVAPYDIALLKLKSPLKWNEKVSPINLPKSGVKPTGNSVLSGWGSITPNGQGIPETLQKVDLPILDLASCKRQLESIVGPSPLHSTNVCTGSPSGQTSACSGDSGGPLIKRRENGVEEVIGVVSWGVMPCGSRGAPSVYTDVAQFVDWITETMLSR